MVLPNFKVYYKDELSAEVFVYSDHVEIIRHIVHPVKQIFSKDKMNMLEFGHVIQLRCWDENRADIDEILSLLNISSYNIYEIVKKTHGQMIQDSIWFEFDGENLCYDEVKRNGLLRTL